MFIGSLAAILATFLFPSSFQYVVAPASTVGTGTPTTANSAVVIWLIGGMYGLGGGWITYRYYRDRIPHGLEEFISPD